MLKLKTFKTMMLVAILGLLALALFGPLIPQPTDQHVFADQRMWQSIPFALDVLSNLSFALWGLAGGLCFFGVLKGTKPKTEHCLASLF